ncbi:MAG: hypothetical protein R8G66_10180 [Cytophagales bacterium]|nr:hypothetical protein [Cytophagales bacterium]
MKRLKIPHLIIIVLCLWVLTAIITFSFYGFFPEVENPGTLGDSFGVANSLFTGLAFALLIYGTFIQQQELADQKEILRDQKEVLSLQKEELALTRKELELTRDELSKTAKAQAKSTELLDIQIKNERDRRKRDIMPSLTLKSPNVTSDNFTFDLKVTINPLIPVAFSYDKKLGSLGYKEFNRNLLSVGTGFSCRFTWHSGVKIQERYKLKLEILFLDIDQNSYNQEVTILPVKGSDGFLKSVVKISVPELQTEES